MSKGLEGPLLRASRYRCPCARLHCRASRAAMSPEPFRDIWRSRCDLNEIGPDKLFATNETLWRGV